MTKNLWILLLGAALVAGSTVACSDDDDGGGSDAGMNGSGMDSGMDTGGGEDISVTSDITEDTTWTAENRYFLDALVFITNGATLEIEAGTQVLGADGSALVVSADGMLDAEGTADNPIVFTSASASPSSGDWGGVVMLGLAPINVGTNNIEGMEASAASEYGGEDPSHDCGTLRYARIEYAGSVFGTDNELNGLTVGGCGSDTTLSYIQVHRGLDDGIEFFGGLANLDHAVVTGAGDDSVDWDEGYQGIIQFLAVVQDSGSGDRGIEADNLGDAPDSTPRSWATVWNATFVGGEGAEQLGLKLRRGTYADIGNTIIMNFGEAAIDIDSAESAGGAEAGDMTFESLLFFNNGPDGSTHFADESNDDDDDGFDEEAFFTDDGSHMFDMDPMIPGTDFSSPDLVPAADSPATNGATPPSGLLPDGNAAYIGAFEPGGDNWMDGWTAFP